MAAPDKAIPTPTVCLADSQRLGQPVQPVDEQHDICRFGRGTGTVRAHRHAHVRCRQCRGIVDAVAHHHAGAIRTRRSDGSELVAGLLFRPHLVHSHCSADRLGDVAPIARQHDNACNAGAAQQAQRLGRVWADLVGEQQRAQHASISRDKGTGGALIPHAPQKSLVPQGRRGAGRDIGVASN
jgi:hypothetical protein